MTEEQNPSWQDVLDLVAQLDGGGLESASVQFGNVSVQVSRSAGALGTVAAPVEAAPVPAAVAVPAPAEVSFAAVVPASPTAPVGETINAPMIGVFYRRPSPSAEAFIAEGQLVEPGTTIGILEIMKLMNPVTAGKAGRITKFLAQDGEAVEFGQPLAAIDTTGA
jgi:acetyl-CoA carboxylase biotin carboxyl carrier protein